MVPAAAAAVAAKPAGRKRPPTDAPDSFIKSLRDSSIAFFSPPRVLEPQRTKVLVHHLLSASCGMQSLSPFHEPVSTKKETDSSKRDSRRSPFQSGRRSRFQPHPIGLPPWSARIHHVDSVGKQARRSGFHLGAASAPGHPIIAYPLRFVNRVTTPFCAPTRDQIVKSVTSNG